VSRTEIVLNRVNNRKVVTIHQPDFMPWLGFFVKISKADTFVVLSHVTNKYNAQSWIRRVKLANKSGAYWFSVSIKKPLGTKYIPINKMEVNMSVSYKNTLETIYRTYHKTPYFHLIYPLIEKWVNSDEPLLIKRNMDFIIDIMNMLNINTEVVYFDGEKCKKKSNELLIAILKSQNADVYICGDGASGYQKNEMYLKENIEVEYNNFKPEKYRQINTKDFQGNLSIVDVLMNIGPEKTRAMIDRMIAR